MQSSSDPEAGSPLYIELVRSRDNPRENQFVLLTALMVIGVAALALVVLQREETKANTLPPALVSLTTQLSSARLEIGLLQEIDLLPNTPDVRDLRDAELVPFAQIDTMQPAAGCFIFDQDPLLLRFRQSPSAIEGWEIAWLDEREFPDLSHALHDAIDRAQLCKESGAWQRYEAPPQ